jgi:very-short-patch-repair endonuclease
LVLGRAGFPEVEVNGVIVNSLGQTIAHGDLVYRAYRTILEYEGDHHRTDERQFNIDIERLDELAEERWRVIRVSKELLRKRATLLGKVDTALRAGGWQPDAV